MPPKRKNRSNKKGKPAKVAKKEGEEYVEAPVIYVLNDGPKNLGNLPQVPMNMICSHLASICDYKSLCNLRKVS